MATDKETSTREEEVQKERQARITKLIKTLEAGADKDDDKFRRVEKLDKERLKLAKKEAKFEDLGQQLWQSTFGGLFKGMTGAVPEPIKILGRMVGVAFGAKGRIKKKKKKLLAKAYKRAAAIGLDTAGWEEKTPEALEEIVENAELLHDIKMPKEPKATGAAYKPIDWLLGKGPQGGGVDKEGGGVGKEDKTIEKKGAESFVLTHDVKLYELMEKWYDGWVATQLTPAQKRELEIERRKKKGLPVAAPTDAGKKDGWFSNLFGVGGIKGLIGRLLPALGLGAGLGAGLAALGAAMLPAAIIIWGIHSAFKIGKEWMLGYKEGGITGAIAKALAGGDDGGWLNSLANGMKWAGAGAFVGLFVGGPLGALVGGLLGLAFGAIFGFFGADKVKEVLDTAKENISRAWDSIKSTFGFPPLYTKAEYMQMSDDLTTLEADIAAMKAEGGPLDDIQKEKTLLENIMARRDLTADERDKYAALLVAEGEVLRLLQEKIDARNALQSKIEAKEAAEALLNEKEMNDLVEQKVRARNVLQSQLNAAKDDLLLQETLGTLTDDERANKLVLISNLEAQLALAQENVDDAYDTLEKARADSIAERKKLADHVGGFVGFLMDVGIFFDQFWNGDWMPDWMSQPLEDLVPNWMVQPFDQLFTQTIPAGLVKLWNGDFLPDWMTKPIGELKIPTLTLPDFEAMLENIKRKFTGGVAEMLSNVPKMFLSADAEAWIEANRDPVGAAKARQQERLDLEGQLGPESDLFKSLGQEEYLRKERLRNKIDSGEKSEKHLKLEAQLQAKRTRLGELQGSAASDAQIIKDSKGPQVFQPGTDIPTVPSTSTTTGGAGQVSTSGSSQGAGGGTITRLKVGDAGLSEANLAKKGTKEFDNSAGVSAAFAPQFQGFVEELVGKGYKINYLGGYRESDIKGTDKASWHQSGMAIDINPGANPYYKYKEGEVGPDTPGAKQLGRRIDQSDPNSPRRWIMTDMPDNIAEIAARHGLGWGGLWGTNIDAMHFSAGRNEGGSRGEFAYKDSQVQQGIVPIRAAAQGLIGFVKKPTLILAGEKGPESVNIRPSTLSQQASGLRPNPAEAGGTTIINAPDNSSVVSTSTNNQLNQDPGWAVFHTPVYRRGGYV